MLTVHPLVLVAVLAFGIWAACDDLAHQWRNRR